MRWECLLWFILIKSSGEWNHQIVIFAHRRDTGRLETKQRMTSSRECIRQRCWGRERARHRQGLVSTYYDPKHVPAQTIMVRLTVSALADFGLEIV